MDTALDGPMPRLIAVTPDEAWAAERIAERLRASSHVCTQLAPGSPCNASCLTAGVSLPLGDLYYLLSWLDHMAGG